MNDYEFVYLASGHTMDTPARVQAEGGVVEFDTTKLDTD